MTDAIDMSVWKGRIDSGEEAPALRWHQVVMPLDDMAWEHSDVLLGFCCDEGVRRNQGRPGAAQGPDAIRQALSGLSRNGDHAVYDAGNIHCRDGDLDRAQAELAIRITDLLERKMQVTVLGGGHELAWGSFQGIVRYLQSVEDSPSRVGIVNFDAHFDLRNPGAGTSSGTPFRQIAEWCARHDREFHYHVIGINPAANTTALFEYARTRKVTWVEDSDCRTDNLAVIEAGLESFLDGIDCLYLTVCLDVFPAQAAPGVSAPAPVGVEPGLVIHLLKRLRQAAQERDIPVPVVDIAEMNPRHDIDHRTARLAARVVWETTRDGRTAVI